MLKPFMQNKIDSGISIGVVAGFSNGNFMGKKCGRGGFCMGYAALSGRNFCGWIWLPKALPWAKLSWPFRPECRCAKRGVRFDTSSLRTGLQSSARCASFRNRKRKPWSPALASGATTFRPLARAKETRDKNMLAIRWIER